MLTVFRNSSPSSLPESSLQPGEAQLRWLRGTRQLDIMAPALRNKVASLTQKLATDREKAVALHDFVKGLPFGCMPDYSVLTASRVLKLGQGDCFAKGLLMVGMLRAAKIPARLHFFSLPSQFLRGILDLEDASIMHAMTEVQINGCWLMTDSYVPDTWLQAGAKRKLLAEGQSRGYGIHLQGARVWDGRSDASAQCSEADAASLPLADWGLADDPESFFADESHSELRRNFASRLKWRLATPLVNKRVAAIRASAARRSSSPPKA